MHTIPLKVRMFVKPILMLTCLPSLLALSAPAADRCLYFTSPALSETGVAAGGILFPPAERISPKLDLHPYRGSVVIRLTPREPFGSAYIEVYPGPPILKVRCSAVWPKPESGMPTNQLAVTIRVTPDHLADGNEIEPFEITVPHQPGQPLHTVWTWSGVEHKFYVNGELKLTHVAKSPFPAAIHPPVRILNISAAELDKAPLGKMAIYNYTLASADVARDFAGTDVAPLVATGVHGPAIIGTWAPAEKRAYAALDSGNDLEMRAASVRFEARDGAGKIHAQTTIVTRRGFAEAVFPVPTLVPGDWQMRAVLLDATGQELASVASLPWNYPTDAPWLGNSLGLTNAVQPPWTPIETEGFASKLLWWSWPHQKGGKLKVWGRTYDLTGGFGLPQQIISQDQPWLAAPVSLELTGTNGLIAIEQPNVSLTQAATHVATWTGEARAGAVRIGVRGRIEYDGMVLLTLRLEPAIPGARIPLSGIRLNTVMPDQRALFLNTSTDQGYYWYPFNGWVPTQPGVVHDNLKQRAGKSSFLFYATFSDHDTGLEWFADNLAGWQVDETKPVQEVVRETDGSVRWVCHLANQPFTLTAPIEITFGYMATPVKALPADWRSWYCHHDPLKDIKSDLAVWWLWSNSTYDKYRPEIFSLRPDDLEKFTAVVSQSRVKPAPFLNQHVTLPAWPDNQRPGQGWPWFNNLLQAESENNGSHALPTRGVRDYWAYNLDQWIASGSMQAIYIDEANSKTIGRSLLSGAGYVKPDGTHGFGHNTLGMREQLKRVRQLFIDHGRRPIVWLPIYKAIIPHAYAFVDVGSEGEAFWEATRKDGGPDFITTWAGNLQQRAVTAKDNGAGAWLLSTSQSQKFGIIPAFLNYLPYWSTDYDKKLRGQYGMLGLLDIIPLAIEQAWFFKAKQDFGMDSPATSFHPFYRQLEIKTDHADVVSSYYRRGSRVLAIITNLGTEPYEGAVRFDLKKLGIAAGEATATRVDAAKPPVYNTQQKRWDGTGDTSVRREPVPWASDGASLAVKIPSHDFQMIEVHSP